MVSGVISLEFSYSLAPFVASLLLGLFSTAEPHQVRHLFIFLSCDSAYLNINKAEGPFYQQTVASPPKKTKKKTNNKNNKTKPKQTKQPPPPQKKKKKKKKTHLSHCMHVGKANYVLFFIELRALLASLTLWDIGCDRNGVRSQERPFWRWVFYFGLWSSFQYKTCFFLGIWISMWRWGRLHHLILLAGIRILVFEMKRPCYLRINWVTL